MAEAWPAHIETKLEASSNTMIGVVVMVGFLNICQKHLITKRNLRVHPTPFERVHVDSDYGPRHESRRRLLVGRAVARVVCVGIDLRVN